MGSMTIQAGFGLAARPAKPPGRFRSACTVMLDTLANRTYSLGLERLKSEAEEAKERYPRLSKGTEFVTRYSFWLGLAGVERKISRYTGPTVSCGIVYTNPFVVSGLAGYAKRLAAPEKKPEGVLSKPSMAAYSGTFAILELASIPAYVFIADRIVRSLSEGFVAPLAAATAVVLANIASMALEYAGFRSIWKRKVLGHMPPGTLKDEVRGFLSEFRPVKLFSPECLSSPAKTAGEYVGQLWGIIEKNYIWIQALRPAFAAGMTVALSVRPALFVDTLFTVMAACGFGWLTGIITAKYQGNISDKIEQNKRSATTD